MCIPYISWWELMGLTVHEKGSLKCPLCWWAPDLSLLMVFSWLVESNPHSVRVEYAPDCLRSARSGKVKFLTTMLVVPSWGTKPISPSDLERFSFGSFLCYYTHFIMLKTAIGVFPSHPDQLLGGGATSLMHCLRLGGDVLWGKLWHLEIFHEIKERCGCWKGSVVLLDRGTFQWRTRLGGTCLEETRNLNWEETYPASYDLVEFGLVAAAVEYIVYCRIWF